MTCGSLEAFTATPLIFLCWNNIILSASSYSPPTGDSQVIVSKRTPRLRRTMDGAQRGRSGWAGVRQVLVQGAAQRAQREINESV